MSIMIKLVIILGVTQLSLGEVLNAKIIGGVEAKIEDHPYQVAIVVEGQLLCGGFLVTYEWVVTAAHCMRHINAGTMYLITVRAGSSYFDKGGQISEIGEAVIYRTYEPATTNNDIALLRLKSPITNQTAKLATLPKQNEDVPDGVEVTVTGWGMTTNNRNPKLPAPVLQKVQLKTINRSSCKDLHADRKITDNMICAGILKYGGKGACHGDSGGPVVLKNGQVIGIVSFGGPICGAAEYPTVSVKLSRYVNSIKEVLKW